MKEIYERAYLRKRTAQVFESPPRGGDKIDDDLLSAINFLANVVCRRSRHTRRQVIYIISSYFDARVEGNDAFSHAFIRDFGTEAVTHVNSLAVFSGSQKYAKFERLLFCFSAVD